MYIKKHPRPEPKIKNGTMKTITKFFWWPKRLPTQFDRDLEETRWWCMSTIQLIYHRNITWDSEEEGWIELYWIGQPWKK